MFCPHATERKKLNIQFHSELHGFDRFKLIVVVLKAFSVLGGS